MASEVVHVFGVLNTPLVIQTGCCGALADGIATGDLFTATEAFCGEGASQYYNPGGETVTASFTLQECFAFDNPREKAHILLDDAQKDELRTAGNNRMIELVLEVAKEYGSRKFG